MSSRIPLWGRLASVCVSVGMATAPAAMLVAEEAGGPFENIKTAPVAVAWEYSNDGGKTFAKTPFAGPPAGQPRNKDAPDTSAYGYVWKGSFEVADPAGVAGLWVRITETNDNPRASICNGDLIAAGGGRWADLGFCPTLLDAAITLNGKEVPIAAGPVLQFWVPLTGEVKKGRNTVEVRGHVYTFWQAAPCAALDAKIIAAVPQPAAVYNGPILGDFGDGYFTLACRTQLPADLTVVATPAEPAAAPVSVVSTNKIWHRVKVEVPRGTRKISYTVSARVGSHETKRGPYTLTLPGENYRFVAFGNALQQPFNQADQGKEPWAVNSKQVLKAKPDFIVNAGNPMEQGSWSFQWEHAYVAPATEMLAGVPALVTPCNRDWTGIYNELHYTPAEDGFGHSWTKVIGPVLFIGIDGNQDWPAGGQNAKWLEEVLGASKEKFIVVLSGYPGYSSGKNSWKMYGARENIRNVVMPLLGKYKASMVLSGWDPVYERIEPTPDKGVTQIVSGSIGRGFFHRWDYEFGSNPFGPGPGGNARSTVGKVALPDGREWVGYFCMRHFCVFDVKDDAIEMKVFACADKPDVDMKDLRVIDQKTFKPRH